jgi:hypothetical protein
MPTNFLALAKGEVRHGLKEYVEPRCCNVLCDGMAQCSPSLYSASVSFATDFEAFFRGISSDSYSVTVQAGIHHRLRDCYQEIQQVVYRTLKPLFWLFTDYCLLWFPSFAIRYFVPE